jgi:hypothetical protein
MLSSKHQEDLMIATLKKKKIIRKDALNHQWNITPSLEQTKKSRMHYYSPSLQDSLAFRKFVSLQDDLGKQAALISTSSMQINPFIKNPVPNLPMDIKVMTDNPGARVDLGRIRQQAAYPSRKLKEFRNSSNEYQYYTVNKDAPR